MAYTDNVIIKVVDSVNLLPDNVLHRWYKKMGVFSRTDLVTAIEATTASVVYDLFTDLNILKKSFPGNTHKLNKRELAPGGRVTRDA